jgi:DNA polymerase-3 subunit delta'
MGFDSFLGSAGAVRQLRAAIGAGRMPPAAIFAGARGAGKYTLAIMAAQTLACRRRPSTDGLPDFCGLCDNCARIAESANLDQRVDEAVAAREEMREADKKETRILVQTHPDLLVIPPDPPQLLIKVGQVRSVTDRIYRLPAESPRAVYIFTSSAFMKEAANALLKALEEPPAYAHLVLLAEDPADLLPTIRSRSSIFRLRALPAAEMDALLARRRPELPQRQRELVARLAEGAAGRALSFDLASYLASRQDALLLLKTALADGSGDPDHSALFRMTETYRAGAEGQEKTASLLRAFARLLEDLLLLHAGSTSLVRNVDMQAELARMSAAVDVAWLEAALRGLTQVEQGMRRNLLRSLSLDGFATDLPSLPA